MLAAVIIQLTRLRTRLGSVINVPVVLTGDESSDAVDDRLIEAGVDVVKQNSIMANQIEVLRLRFF